MLKCLGIQQQSIGQAFLPYNLYFYSNIKMRANPFSQCYSPIASLYKRSKSKSQENRIPVRNRSKSFKDFQVNMISQALKQNHILQKEYNNDKQKRLEKERKHTKLYGLHPALPQTPKLPQPAIATDKSAPLERRNSEMMSTMLNIRTQTMNAINSQRKMTYESNWNIHEEFKDSHAYIPSQPLVSQKGISRKGSRTSSERKCSIFNDLAKEKENKVHEEYTDGIKRSRFVVNKNEKTTHLDKVNEEYFEDSKSKKSSQKSGTTRQIRVLRF